MSAHKNNECQSGSSKNTEGYLTKRLHSAFALTTEKFLSSIKYSTFKKSYRTIYESKPDEMKRNYDDWISQMHRSIQEDFEEICDEHSIHYLLFSLEKINDNQCSNTAWRPSGNPDEDLRDHTYPLKVKHKENLEKVLDKLMVANEELVNIYAINHAEIMHIRKVNEDLHGKFTNIVTSLCGPNLQNLEKKMEDAFQEI